MPNDSYDLSGKNSADLLQRGRNQVEELVVLVLSTVHGMWRYRWFALLLAWGTSIAGWLFIYALPDVYQASARIYVDAESMIKRAVGDLTVSADMTSEINVLARAMLSQPQLEKIAREAELDLFAESEAEREAVITLLSETITIAREGGENIFRIDYENPNRATSELVVRVLLDSFVEDALGERRTDSGAAQEFLESQITEYERRLNEAEERLAEFKRINIGLMPGETGDYYTRLQGSMESLAETKAELRLATERRVEYTKQLEGEEPTFGVLTSAGPTGPAPAASGSDALIAQYEAELESLLLKYTENHPDAVALRATIERLKGQQQASRAQLPAQGPISGLMPIEANPVYQRMRMGLSETEVEIATLRTKLAAEEANIAGLQKLVDTIPEIERQLTALNRDYDVTREQYEVLLQRRESLHITGEVEQSGDQLLFRELDPPRASLTPVGPDRPVLLAGTALFALGLGGALAFLLHQLNPVFSNRRELREGTGLPVLGAVSLAHTAAERAASRRRRLVFITAACALPVALGLAILLQSQAHQAVANLLRTIS